MSTEAKRRLVIVILVLEVLTLMILTRQWMEEAEGALHLYNKFNMHAPSNMFVVEYASRPDLASIFYEDVLMAVVLWLPSSD